MTFLNKKYLNSSISISNTLYSNLLKTPTHAILSDCFLSISTLNKLQNKLTVNFILYSVIEWQ